MNRRMVFRTVGLIIFLEALLLLLPTAVSMIYREESVFAFLITIGIALFAAAILIFFFRPKNRVLYAKEGFAITSLAWLSLSAIGALPFYLSGQVPLYMDAFFETVSGFTTTGASVLTNLEALDHGILFWRSFTHWVGGMGVLVFIAALLPNLSDRTIHILRAEMPGPTMGKIMPKLRDTAKILYLIYIGITVLEVLLLCLGDMSLFDSLIHTFGSVGTGGFGVYSDSAASFTPYQTWVITVFMFLCGINFNLFYLALTKRFRSVFQSSEFWVYTGIVAVATIMILANTAHLYDSLGIALRHSSFQVISVLTTTGFSTLDFNLWPAFSKAIILILMFLGGCAGSTAGGLKISRVILLFKNLHTEFRHMLHPRSVNVLRMDGKKVEPETRKGVMVYFALYMLCILIIFLLISLNGFDFETNFSAAVTTFNNVGPGFGMVGPFGSFAAYSSFSKFVLSMSMLLGRLEIWPILLTFYPIAWQSKNKTKG